MGLGIWFRKESANRPVRGVSSRVPCSGYGRLDGSRRSGATMPALGWVSKKSVRDFMAPGEMTVSGLRMSKYSLLACFAPRLLPAA